MLPVHHISGEAENGVARDADSPMTADSDGDDSPDAWVMLEWDTLHHLVSGRYS
jgi:hypothetical protein